MLILRNDALALASRKNESSLTIWNPKLELGVAIDWKEQVVVGGVDTDVDCDFMSRPVRG